MCSSDLDSDTDSDTDTDADTDADTDTDTETDLSEDPVRPPAVGENYSSAGVCGCSTDGGSGAGVGLLLGVAALTRRRKA